MATRKKRSSARRGSSSRKGGARKASRGRSSSRSSARGGARRKSARRKTGAKRAPNPAFMRPMTPSPQLAAVVGSSPMPRTEITKKLWQYIKRKGLQDEKNRRAINADENLRPIFKRDQVSMFDMTKLVNKHLS
jgi:upstream activation factor subunit UAF30